MAWALAAWHPDRVRSLTAVSVPHPAAYTVAYRADPEQKERSAYIRLFWQPGKAEEVLLADDAPPAAADAAGGEGDTGVPAEAVDEYVAVLSAPGALTAALNWYRAMSSGDRGGPGRCADDLRVERRRRRDRPDRRGGVRANYVTGRLPVRRAARGHPLDPRAGAGAAGRGRARRIAAS